MGVNKYASTFPMFSCNKKTCNYRKKRGVKKYENAQLFLQVHNCTLVNVNAPVVATTSWWLHFTAPVVA